MKAIKPGYLPEEAYKNIHEGDTQEIIDICLSCKIEGDCKPDSKECPLNAGILKGKANMRMEERDKKILELINEGLSYRAIGRKLGVNHTTVLDARDRLKKDWKLK